MYDRKQYIGYVVNIRLLCAHDAYIMQILTNSDQYWNILVRLTIHHAPIA